MVFVSTRALILFTWAVPYLLLQAIAVKIVWIFFEGLIVWIC